MMKSSPLAHHPPTATNTQWFSTWGDFCSQGTFLVVIFEVGVGGEWKHIDIQQVEARMLLKILTLHK